MDVRSILQECMERLGLGDGEESYQARRTQLISLLNEGIMDISNSIRPWQRHNALLEQGKLNTGRLPFSCEKLLFAHHKGQRVLFYYGRGPEELVFPGLEEGRVQLTYRYRPAAVELDEDEVELPAYFQPLLVEYICLKMRSGQGSGGLEEARLALAQYEQQKRHMSLCYPEPTESRFYNR